jgi:branched-chain amino acid transport system permease protein
MLSQVVITGFVVGAAYGLVATSFALICHAVRFFHLAHAATYTVAAYLTLYLLITLSLPALLAIPLAIVGTGLLGYLMYVVVYLPLQNRSSSPAILLLSSLGILTVLQGIISLNFGDAIQSIRISGAQLGFNLAGARVTSIQVLTGIVSVALSWALWMWLRYSRVGLVLRALANDEELSRVFGVQRVRMSQLALVLGSALAGVAAILNAYDTDLTPMMGFRVVLVGIVAAIVGGIGSIPGAYAGGLLIGLVQQFAAWTLPGQWQEAVVFIILILMLVVRPQGLLNRPLR